MDDTKPVPPVAPDLLVENLWKLFEARVVPERTSVALRAEMRIFFFAGAASLFGTINGLIETLGDDEANAMMDRVTEELVGFDNELDGLLAQRGGAAGRTVQ